MLKWVGIETGLIDQYLNQKISFYKVESTRLDVIELYTVHPNEIVTRQGPPLVDHDESDRKVNQICIAILGHCCNAFWLFYNTS